MIDNDSLDKIKAAIMARTGISIDALDAQIDEKISLLNGLMTKIGAALVIADKMHVAIDLDDASGNPGSGDEPGGLQIKDLIDGMKNVDIAGRVINVYPVKDFTRKTDGKPGKVGSMIIEDETGSARVALWNQKTGMLARIREGDVVEIYNASVKTGYKGGVEINVGDKTDVNINPNNVDASRFPPATPSADGSASPKGAIPIASATEVMRFCTLKAIVTAKAMPKEFVKKDGTTGTIGRVTARDESGSATIIFWSERMGDYENIVIGNTYEFSGVAIKFSKYADGLEFTVNKNTAIALSNE